MDGWGRNVLFPRGVPGEFGPVLGVIVCGLGSVRGKRGGGKGGRSAWGREMKGKERKRGDKGAVGGEGRGREWQRREVSGSFLFIGWRAVQTS